MLVTSIFSFSLNVFKRLLLQGGKKSRLCGKGLMDSIAFCQPLFHPFSTISLNAFPHVKILDQTKLKAFADDKLNITNMIISVFDRVENIVGKGEIACTSNFSFSHNVFKRLLSQTSQKVSLCGNGLTLSIPNI